MKIILLSIGKKDEPEYKDAIDLFTKRASHYFDVTWQLIPSAKNSSAPIETIKKEEGEAILSKTTNDDYVILLDEKGNNISTPIFSELLQKHLNKGTKKIVCIIGGAYGVSNAVLVRANFTWSLSNLVFPHQIARLLLIEQLYRAGTILKGEKYHHQ